MDNLSLAVSTIPFYERNSVDESLFSETDMLSMNNRAIKYKQKYYDDKTYSTSETEAQDRILNSLKESLSKNYVDNEKIEKVEANPAEKIVEAPENDEDRSVTRDDINLDFTFSKTDISSPVHSKIEIKDNENKSVESKVSSTKSMEDIDNLVDNTPEVKQEVLVEKTIYPPIVIVEKESTKEDNKPIKGPIATRSTENKVKGMYVYKQ